MQIRFEANSRDFHNLPGCPISYWISKKSFEAFSNGTKLENETACAAGVSSGDNDKYLRLWHEVSYPMIALTCKTHEEFEKSTCEYVFCNKGGEFRKWYGNNDYVAWWKKSNEFHRNGATYKELLFVEGLTWSAITTGLFNARYYPDGFIFDHASPSLFADNQNKLYLFIGFTNSKVCGHFLGLINPTLNTGADTLRKVPICFKENSMVSECVRENIKLSKADWDDNETSNDFSKHPLL